MAFPPAGAGEGDIEISKLDIFHYVYGLLHSPEYREKYSANLRLELPRIPMVKSSADFWAFVTAGERLADLHVNYENQQEYKLELIENPNEPLSWRVDKMRLSKDKTGVVYNGFLTLGGIPPQAFEYKLGTRSALEWVIRGIRRRKTNEAELLTTLTATTILNIS
jgi:predicted helicase